MPVQNEAAAGAAFRARRGLGAVAEGGLAGGHRSAGGDFEPGHVHQALAVVAIHGGEPQRRLAGGLHHLVQAARLDHPVAVQVHAAGVVDAAHWAEPIAADLIAVRIEIPEGAARDDDLPSIAGDFFPALGDLGAGDDHLFARCGLIDDGLGLGFTAAGWIHAFAVGSGMHRDGVTRLRFEGGGGNRQERLRRSARGLVIAGLGNMQIGRHERRGGQQQT